MDEKERLSGVDVEIQNHVEQDHAQNVPVTIHHIICKDTVDEDVMAALEQKDVNQEKLIAAVKARLY